MYSEFPSDVVLSVFISYSHNDMKIKKDIERFFQSNLRNTQFLSDDLLEGGEIWSEKLYELRSKADVFLLLVSNAYLHSSTVRQLEWPQIRERAENAAVYIIPVILEQCDWKQEWFAKYQAIPKFGRPFGEFENPSEVYTQALELFTDLLNLRRNRDALQIIKEEKEKRTGILRLSRCRLEAVPHDISQMEWLTELYLNDNNIAQIKHLDNSVQLKILDLSNNVIEAIENLDSLKNLVELDLMRNRLERIEKLDNNNKLEVLGLSYNRIQDATGIGHLKELKKLYLAHNGLANINELLQLPQLKRIVLTGNAIQSVKPLLPHLKSGLKIALDYSFDENEEGIFIKDNRTISEPPIEVIQSGADAVLKYFDAAKNYRTRKLEILKLILVGNSNVGKTNLSEFLRGLEITPAHNSTHILDIQTWHAPFLRSESGQLMRVNIFDFGGQDYYHDSHRLYYSHDTAYILLWDTGTNKYSEEVERGNEPDDTIIYENYPLEYWLESINYNLAGRGKISFDSKDDNKKKSTANNPPILILQNKIDVEEGRLDQKSLATKYENIAGFFNISLVAKKRTDVLPAVLSDYMNALNLAGRQLIEYEYKIVEDFLLHPREFSVLSLDEFHQECITIINNDTIVFEKDNARIIAEILNAIGILFYANTLQGDGLIFTQVTKLNELIKEVMDIAKKGNDKGIFSKNQLEQLPYKDKILELLINNNSIIDIGNDQFLVPQFLPLHPDPSVEFFLTAFNFTQVRFIYKAYFHKSLLLSLFSTYIHESISTNNPAFKANLFWRNGIIIQRGEGASRQIVFVEFVKTESCGIVNIKTMKPFNKLGLEKEIETTLDKLNKGWTVIKEVSVNSKDFFDLNYLSGEIENGIFEFAKNGSIFRASDFKSIADFARLPKKLFISYSSKNAEFIKRFITHLEVLKSMSIIEPWYDRMIEAGTKWDDSIKKEIKSADVIIFLLSPDFLATEYIMKTELPMAIEQLEGQSSKFFFIELQACGWKRTIINQYQQNLDPNSSNKEIISIGKPDNDAAWNKVINVLEDKLK